MYKTKAGKVTIVVYMNEDTHHLLKAMSIVTDRSMSGMIRFLIKSEAMDYSTNSNYKVILNKLARATNA